MEKILVHSYKGGTGKTMVALNIANILSHDSRVLLIENDFIMPSFFDIFDRKPNAYFNDYLNEIVTFDQIIETEVKSNLDVVFTNKNFDPNEKVMGSDQDWFISQLRRMIKDLDRFEDKYDYVIFDTPPGWHLIVVNLIMMANKAILLLRPNSYAVRGTKRMIEILYKRAKPISRWDVYLLFNQVPKVNMKSDLEIWAEQFQKDGIKCAGSISCSCDTSYEMAHEVTIFPLEHKFTQDLQGALNILLEAN